MLREMFVQGAEFYFLGRKPLNGAGKGQNAAIQKRIGQFGSTKMRQDTINNMKEKGMAVGIPEKLPLRSGQNRMHRAFKSGQKG